MAEIHPLRSALPEGWRPVPRGFERDVGPWDVLRVNVLLPGRLRGLINASSVGLYRSLGEAIAGVEAAYCGCRIRSAQGG